MNNLSISFVFKAFTNHLDYSSLALCSFNIIHVAQTKFDNNMLKRRRINPYYFRYRIPA